MNDAPRRTLRELIARHGPGLCGDARRCEGLLRDLAGAHRREVNILLGALRERVPLDLLAGRSSIPRDLLLTRLSKRLEEHQALTEDAARWAVESWALALGVVSDDELEEGARRRAEASAPRVENISRGADPNTRPTATPPPTQQRPTPPPVKRPQPPPPTTTQPPPVARPTGARPSAPWPTPMAAPVQRAPSSPQAASAGPLQAPSPDPPARGARRRWRGCLVGCFLLILLIVLLFAGGPFVLNILREEQRQRGLESPPVQTQ